MSGYDYKALYFFSFSDGLSLTLYRKGKDFWYVLQDAQTHVLEEFGSKSLLDTLRLGLRAAKKPDHYSSIEELAADKDRLGGELFVKFRD